MKGSPPEVSASRVVVVEDFSSDTIENIIHHLEVSREFEHFVYREAELDAVWSLVEFQSRRSEGTVRELLLELLAKLWQAHDLVGMEERQRALESLREAAAIASKLGAYAFQS